ncbi:MAG: VWA domain-containing protein [Gammaproteobacteria bacterium]|nr:VWA domain-containing protein [Gammaproteobacteria bacterium]
MSVLSALHWLRPAWLWALLPLAFIVWRLLRQSSGTSAWESQCDPHLLARLLVRRTRHHRLPLLLLALGWTLAVIALAGPVWQKLPQPVYQTHAARVIVLDLSPSMNAPDLRPSRIARARFKIMDLLARFREGQTSLVVFAEEPFVVAPLTDDTQTIAALLPALTPELLPAPGNHAHAALRLADDLLSQAGIHATGDIILVSDGYDDPAAVLEAVTVLRDHGRQVSVLAVGTPEGAPIPLPAGGFLKDAAGAMVIPRLDPTALTELARQGHGHFAPLSVDDRDIDALLSDQDRPWAVRRESSQQRSMDRWREEGPWLVLVLVPLAAFAFRRGWLSVVVLGVLAAPPPVSAFGWKDLWTRPDQQGVQALQAGAAQQAARLLQDPAWKGSAQYRAGDYEKALENFSQLHSVDALYNRGNALAHLGRLQEAISAYDQALEQEPHHADAQHNKALVEKLLEQQQQDNAQHPQDQNGAQNQSAPADQASSSKDQPPSSPDQDHSQDDQQERKKNEPSASSKKNSKKEQPQAHQDQQQASDSTPATLQQEQEKTAEKPNKPPDTTAPSAAKAPQDAQPEAATQAPELTGQSENQQALNQWLQRIPDDPGGLLRRKFWLEHLRRQQQAQ